MGARGRRGPAARDLREQARPRARGLRGHARPARVELRQPGRAVRAADRRRARFLRDRRPAAREGRPLSERPQGRGVGVARRPARDGRPRAREADRGRRGVRRRAHREVPRQRRAPRGAHRVGREGRVRACAARAGARAGRPSRRSASTGCSTSSWRSSPHRSTAVRHGGREGRRGGERASPTRTVPSARFVFKTVSDPFVGHITMFRVFSGQVRPDSTVFNATDGTEERSASCSRCGARTTRPSRGPGRRHRRGREAAARTHRRHVVDEGSTRSTLPSDRACPSRCSPCAIAPKTKGDEDKLSTGLARLAGGRPDAPRRAHRARPTRP